MLTTTEKIIPVHATLYCPRCSYLLRGLTLIRCPECGQDFTTLKPSFHPSCNPRTAILLKWARRFYYALAIQWLPMVAALLMLILLREGEGGIIAVLWITWVCLVISILSCGLVMLVLLVPLCLKTVGFWKTLYCLFILVVSSYCLLLGLVLIPPLLLHEIETLWHMRPSPGNDEWSTT